MLSADAKYLVRPGQRCNVNETICLTVGSSSCRSHRVPSGRLGREDVELGLEMSNTAPDANESHNSVRF